MTEELISQQSQLDSGNLSSDKGSKIITPENVRSADKEKLVAVLIAELFPVMKAVYLNPNVPDPTLEDRLREAFKMVLNMLVDPITDAKMFVLEAEDSKFEKVRIETLMRVRLEYLRAK